MRCLVTGTAGFIGFHLARRLLQAGHEVAGIDSMTPYYDITLKQRREAMLAESRNFSNHRLMLEDSGGVTAVFADFRPETVVHLAAQAGVRYSLENPKAYIDSNIVGTFSIIEACRHQPVRHLMMASTSSVYGANTNMPFAETDQADHQITLYAASKKATEEMGHCYAHLFGTPTTMFRFFTVYGPWGRPDMALFKFVKNTLEGLPIDVYNHGRMERDFTYIDDLIDAIVQVIDCPPERGKPVAEFDTLSPVAPFRTLNIGGGRPVGLIEFIEVMERELGIASKRNYLDMQPGDVPRTTASPDLLQALIGSIPRTPVTEGVPAFIRWFRDYYGYSNHPGADAAAS
jgi:UDP-glucuronate 4-epimerase